MVEHISHVSVECLGSSGRLSLVEEGDESAVSGIERWWDERSARSDLERISSAAVDGNYSIVPVKLVDALTKFDGKVDCIM